MVIIAQAFIINAFKLKLVVTYCLKEDVEYLGKPEELTLLMILSEILKHRHL